jgi:adenylate cyclase 10
MPHVILFSFGVGDINMIFVGGVLGRSEYLATGDPLVQAFHSEHHATGGG